jgi:hypothetical protein
MQAHAVRGREVAADADAALELPHGFLPSDQGSSELDALCPKVTGASSVIYRA